MWYAAVLFIVRWIFKHNHSINSRLGIWWWLIWIWCERAITLMTPSVMFPFLVLTVLHARAPQVGVRPAHRFHWMVLLLTCLHMNMPLPMMLLQCANNVLSNFLPESIECLSGVHWMSIRSPLDVYPSPLNVYLMSIECLSDVHWMSIRSPLNVHRISMSCLWDIHVMLLMHSFPLQAWPYLSIHPLHPHNPTLFISYFIVSRFVQTRTIIYVGRYHFWFVIVELSMLILFLLVCRWGEMYFRIEWVVKMGEVVLMRAKEAALRDSEKGRKGPPSQRVRKI